MTEALIVDAVRSAIGRRNGTLATVRADDLAAEVLNGLIGRVGLDPAHVEDVQMGCVTQIGEQALNVGRVATLVAGWPETVAATTVDRQCGSSMQAAFNAAAAIQAGHLDVVVAAGVESMSRVPMGSNLGAEGWAGLNRSSRNAGRSCRRASRPRRSRRSGGSRATSSTRTRSSRTARGPGDRRGAVRARDRPGRVRAAAGVLFAVDETPRRDTSLEKLASLQPAFTEDGVVTAGNSSQIVDGAAAMLLVSEDTAARHGLEPRARFVSFGLAGVDPYRMLHGNPQACAQALAAPGSAGTTSR